MKRYYALSVLLLTSMMVMAQDLKITKIELNTKIQTALVNQEVDPVGQRKCAVLHVVTEGLTPEERNYMLQFQLDNAHSIVKTVKDSGEIQLYVPEGTVRLTVKSELGNYRCDFREHGLRDGVESLKDYYVYIVYNRPASGPKEENMGGQLNLTSSPSNCEVYLDGKLIGKSPDIFANILAGSHKVELRKEGYESVTKQVTIEEGKIAQENLTLTKKQQPAIPEASSTSGALTFTANGVTFKMLPVEGGTFTMGATSEQGSYIEDDEKPTHSVTLSGFYMGETEVTQALWQTVMGKSITQISDEFGKDLYGVGDNYPMYYISWNDCQEFIAKLNQICASQLNGKQFALPTEAQWEYAARGGKQSRGYKYSGSNDLSSIAWYDENSGGKIHAVGTKQANELGLYDMSGNVLEWCQDWYGDYGSSAQTNPTGPDSGMYRMLRGGCWNFGSWLCRVSCRSSTSPSRTDYYLGLRIVLP